MCGSLWPVAVVARGAPEKPRRQGNDPTHDGNGDRQSHEDRGDRENGRHQEERHGDDRCDGDAQRRDDVR
jgi:hypothetical protein